MDAMFSTLRYGNSEEQAIDLFLPEASNGTALFFIHGGGWAKGSRTAWHPVARLFRTKGYVCASIGYRLAPEALHPAQLEDVRRGVATLKSCASDLLFRTDRTVVIGSSAGGHLAAMLSSIGPSDPLGAGEELAFPDTKPAAAVLYCPVTDLAEANNPDPLNRSIVRFMGFPEQSGNAEYRRMSPVDRIAEQTVPPTLILHGDSDSTVPLRQSEAYHERLLVAGVRSELVVLENVGHGFGYGVETPAQQKSIERIEAFLKDVFGKQGRYPGALPIA